MLSDFKKFVNPIKRWARNNESDIFLTISIVLISLIIFGSIILINFSKENESIMIQNPSASVIENIMINSDESIEQGNFVGSINSIKYHWPDCSFAKRISEENKVWFPSEQEAQNSGYIRCGSFEKYAPKNN